MRALLLAVYTAGLILLVRARGHEHHQHDATHSHEEEGDREKRAVGVYKTGDKHLWTKGIVGYVIEKGLKSSTEKIIKDAIKHLEDHTCIQFQKGKQKNYISFTKTAGTCSSVYGMHGGKQQLFISEDRSEGCASIPVMIHEIMHALGVDHEMKRADQRKYIDLFPQNIKNKKQFDVDKKLSYKPYKYDLSSVMQYDNKFLRKSDGSVTLEAKNPDYNYLVSRTTKSYSLPSFEDMKLLNDMYQCGANCKKNNCKNNGYPAGKKCACHCPKGLTGRNCEKQQDKCGSVMKKKEGTIDSSKDMKVATTLMDSKMLDQTCSWTVQADDKEIVHLSFFDHVHTEDNNAGTNYIAIRADGVEMPGLHKYGAVDHSDMAYAIEGSAMVRFAMKGTNGFGLGFKANFQVLDKNSYEKACKNKVCFNGGAIEISGSKCSCKCLKGYKGSKCEKFSNSKCNKKLPCLNRGVLNVADKNCDCDCPDSKGASAEISGPRCQYLGQCHQRLDKKFVTMIAPPHVNEPAPCKGLQKCDGTLKTAALCPIQCGAPCECIDALDLKKAGLCKTQKGSCGDSNEQKALMMEIGCQKTCKACPKFE